MNGKWFVDGKWFAGEEGSCDWRPMLTEDEYKLYRGMGRGDERVEYKQGRPLFKAHRE